MYDHPEPVYDIYCGKNYLLIGDWDDWFWSLCFEHSHEPEESLKLKSQIRLVWIEEPPTFCFPYATWDTCKICFLDIRTGERVIEKQIAKTIFKNHSPILLNEEYIVYEAFKKIYIYELVTITKSRIKISYDGPIDQLDLRKHLFFIRSNGSEALIFYRYNLKNNKWKKISLGIKGTNVSYLDDYCFVVRNSENQKQIYRWNSDYSEISLVKELVDEDVSMENTLSLSYFRGILQANNLHLYSNNWKKLKKIETPGIHDYATSDGASKIYYPSHSNGSFYLNILDFGFVK